MDVQRRDDAAGRVWVTPSGQVDLASAPQLAEALDQAWRDGVTEMVVDLSAVDFLDSAGVRVLVHAAREATQADATVYLSGAQGWVARVLDITGVSGYFPALPE